MDVNFPETAESSSSALMRAPPSINLPTSIPLEFSVTLPSPEVWREWQQLERRIHSPFLMCSADWSRIWVQAYGDQIPHKIVVARRSATPVAMALLTNGVMQREGPLSVRSIHLGTAGEADADSACVEYNRLLVADIDRMEFTRGLLQLIHADSYWEVLRLDGMAVADASPFLSMLNQPGIQELKSHYCDLNVIRDAPSEPWRIFGDSTRSNLRRSLRDLGSPILEWSESIDQGIQFYDELIEHHQARWNAAGKPGAFASRRFTEFHRQLISELLPSGRVALVRARQGERLLGLLYLLIEENRLLYYQAGLPEHTSKLSLGSVTQYLTMVEGARRGYSAFDFLAGDAGYKKALSTHSNTLYWISWKRHSMKFLIMEGLRSLKRAVS